MALEVIYIIIAFWTGSPITYRKPVLLKFYESKVQSVNCHRSLSASPSHIPDRHLLTYMNGKLTFLGRLKKTSHVHWTIPLTWGVSFHIKYCGLYHKNELQIWHTLFCIFSWFTKLKSFVRSLPKTNQHMCLFRTKTMNADSQVTGWYPLPLLTGHYLSTLLTGINNWISFCQRHYIGKI